ncbi:D-alanyl-D-alanine carboxypeptidase/D-alanyl-D-alanine endopeptidase [Demetria terragena]|uniref:D-alanyl-D-alanine carboxypeptidase/D-alanyl-D-alanine endopeptidase n=1 Tax=Demetria terragena TaxID=63959 RepID=UPI00036EAFB7|nr:D-alanyl-D-alanine carboxypeptidase/D-alanyl-D-alanine-endopeptidase [Demetria terragena]
MRRSRKILAGSSAVVVLVAAYATLDAVDIVPGVLTTADAPREPVPLPGESAPPQNVRVPSAPQLPQQTGTLKGPMPDRAALRAAIAPLVGAKSLGTTALDVRDAKTGTRLYQKAPDAALTPASITKVLSAYAVAKTLGADRTLATTAVSGGDGKVVLVAGGDTALGTGAGDPDAVRGHAGLGDLAQQVAIKLKAEGRTEVQISWDLSYAPGPLQASTWSQDVVDQGFTTRISMLGLDEDRSDPGNAPPQDPAKSASEAFVKALQRQGITATVGQKTTAPTDAKQLGVVRSAPLSAVLGLAMRSSDNAMIESLVRQGAAAQGVPGDTTSVTAWVVGVLRADGIDVRGVRLRDAAGLADGTTIPARVITDVLMRGVTGKAPAFQEVVAQFPVASLNGTLDDRFFIKGAEAGRGIVRAKTGSLPGVSSLAGTLVTQDGRELVFTIVSNGKAAAGPVQTRADLDRVISALAKCGC